MEFTGDLDEMSYLIFRAVHPDRRQETESTRDRILFPREKKICSWLEKEKLTLTKVHIKLLGLGVDVSYSHTKSRQLRISRMMNFQVFRLTPSSSTVTSKKST